MGYFHRDKQVLNVEIDEARLRQLIQVFEGFFSGLAGQHAQGTNGPEWQLSYVVRFDEKGFRVFAGTEVLELFNQANVVERIVLALDSTRSLATNRADGAWFELKLDATAPSNCWVNVTADSKPAMDATYQAIDEVLATSKTRYGLLRTNSARFAIQAIGVVLSFAFSVWGGSLVASQMAIQNAFPIAVLFVLLLFSNAWAFFQPWVLAKLDKVFPNIYFKRSGFDRWAWLWQGLVVAAIFGVLTAVFLFMLHYLALALTPLFRKAS